ncbi:MAG: hypothetical protein H6719_23725 [Sandaracinaceae bacterium]|nr:hypothetical protein [Sandaracinaceae bacterium]
MGRLLLIAALLGGCTCTHEAPPEPRLPTPPATEPSAPRSDAWPEAVIDLERRPPATRITIRPTSVELDNHAMVATWPAAALSRARATPEPGRPAWPRLHETAQLDDDERLASLLRLSRRAERAATGAGEGAGICDLRVGADVSFADFERVLRAAGLAGYGAPRVLLGEEEALLAFEWPRAASSGAPTQAQIVEALGAIERGEEPSLADPGASDVRVRLSDAGARVTLRGERRCPTVTPETISACLQGLVFDVVTLEVAGEPSFGEVVPWVQQASTATTTLRVRGAQ